MPFRSFSRTFRLAAVAAALSAGASARAQLSAVSPFAPPDNGSANQADPNAIEYRGTMSSGKGTLYLIYDPVKHLSTWVGLNEPGSPYSVRLDDVLNERITLQVNGQQLVLPLRTAKVGAGPTINPAALGQMQPNMQIQSIGGPAVLHPTAEDEQRRLQSVADEVRRRRQAREQAQAAAQPGAAQ